MMSNLTKVNSSRRGVNVIYGSDSGQAINTALTVLTFEDMVEDDDGLYSAGNFVPEVSDFYNIKVSCSTSSLALSTSQFVQLLIYINGVERARTRTYGTGVAHVQHCHLSRRYFLTPSDTVTIYIQSDVATTLTTTATSNELSISN